MACPWTRAMVMASHCVKIGQKRFEKRSQINRKSHLHDRADHAAAEHACVAALALRARPSFVGVARSEPAAGDLRAGGEGLPLAREDHNVQVEPRLQEEERLLDRRQHGGAEGVALFLAGEPAGGDGVLGVLEDLDELVGEELDRGQGGFVELRGDDLAAGHPVLLCCAVTAVRRSRC